MLFSSALLGVYKPAQESYQKVLGLVKLEPAETVQVAANAYGLCGAKTAGTRMDCINRWMDVINEGEEVVRKENEYFSADMTRLPEVIAEMQLHPRGLLHTVVSRSGVGIPFSVVKQCSC